MHPSKYVMSVGQDHVILRLTYCALFQSHILEKPDSETQVVISQGEIQLSF
jgi:hypothetical protein